MLAAILFVTSLLIVGVAMRLRFRVLRSLYLPASVVAGGVGLAALNLAPAPLRDDADRLTATLASWPAWLIAIVFAGMLLENRPGPARRRLPRVARQGLMVWVIVLGQAAVGLLATGLLVLPFVDVPNSFGMLIETGFAGGHGTATAMGEVFANPIIDLPEGAALGTLMATCGLVYGIVSGVLWVNLAVRLGWVAASPRTSADPAATSPDARGQGPAPAEGFGPIGTARIGGDTLDPLLWQGVWLMAAFGVGVALQSLVTGFTGWLDLWLPETSAAHASSGDAWERRLSFGRLFGEFPLFIYTLFGGWIVRVLLVRTGRGGWIDHRTINRLTSSAMDVLVVAAVASLSLQAVVSYLAPFAVLLAAGAAWAAVCLLVLARWILPGEYWFQLGLINYGMSTGTTATGFVLLKMIDPDLESGAAEDYAMAAPLSSPFVGGGIVTFGLPLLVLERFPIWWPGGVLAAVVFLLVVAGRRWNRREAAGEASTASSSPASSPRHDIRKGV